MKSTYNKLIRDRIPEIITNVGKKYATEVMEINEYKQALLSKLVEEAQEAAQSKEDDLITEIADLYEVIDTLLTTWNITHEEVIDLQKERRQQRGGFEKRLKLLWTE